MKMGGSSGRLKQIYAVQVFVELATNNYYRDVEEDQPS